MERCPWCLRNEKMMIRYHDGEWGVPVHDDRKQFELLMMEVMQYGLNWNMMIQKREIFRNCFDNFDFDKVAAYGGADIERIMDTNGMIRSRRKIEAVIHNARCFQKIRTEFGSFSEYIWGFTKGKTYLYMGLLHGNCIFGILNKKNRPGPPRCAALQNGFFVKNDEKADFLSLSVPPGIPALALLSLRSVALLQRKIC